MFPFFANECVSLNSQGATALMLKDCMHAHPQAKNLVWRDLSAEQLENIRHPHPKKGQSGRDLLALYTGITNPNDDKSAITLDLYTQTLRFGEVRARPSGSGRRVAQNLSL